MASTHQLRSRRIAAIFLGCIALAMATVAPSETPRPPQTEKRPVATTLFGDERIDEYSWLHNIEDPAVIEHLKRENAYTDAILAPLEPLRDQLHREMIARLPSDDRRPAMLHGPWEYYERNEAELDYLIYCRRPAAGGEEQIVLDDNILAEGKDYFSVTARSVSSDHQLLAYIEELDGDDVGNIRFHSIAPHITVPNTIIENVWIYSLAWDADSTALYYVRTDDTQRPASVWRHLLGTDPSADEKLFEETDGRFAVDVFTSRSNEIVFIHAAADDTSQILALDASDPISQPRVIFPKRDGNSAKQVAHRRGPNGGWFYAIDNVEDALDGRLVRRPITRSADDTWEVVLPEEPGVSLLNLVMLENWLALEERRDGYRVIRVMRHDGSDAHVIPACPTPGWTTLEQGPEYAAPFVQIETSAPLEELTTYKCDPENRTTELIYQRPTPINTSLFAVETIFGIAPDGVRIPVTVVYHRDNPRDRSAPAILTGYGGVGATMEPGFYPTRLYASMLERGVTIAIAHVRGGGFYGPRWHNQAKLETKHITYTDFVACAEALIREGFTSPQRLAFNGGSSGGTLVSAAINLRPDIARVVVAEVPFVDCLNSMLDPTLPATTLDYPELGNPAEERYYRSIRTFAPYENIGPRDYPDILATGGINDVRVAYWEPAKWVARIRDQRLDSDGLTLLRLHLGAGHLGSSARRDALLEQAEIQAFIYSRIGNPKTSE